ncbi:MAG: metallophosphoesterase [Verrucomicrobia bacterium]|nr:metallophosphoesterase [Verrucomicrobiota bacterium]
MQPLPASSSPTARRTVVILSDIHYGGAAEASRGWRETEFIKSRVLRLAVRAHRRFIWMRDPFAHNDLLDRFCAEVSQADLVIANGDFSCDTAFVGVSDEAAFQSARECLGKLRQKFGERLLATIGDHELGKRSLFGGQGGMRLASWRRMTLDLGLQPFWRVRVGRYVLLGITSSLVALPIYLPETFPEEQSDWEVLRFEHVNQIREAVRDLQPTDRLILLCHDPTALPFLWRETPVRAKADQIALTIVGHLHSKLLLWQSRWLSGMPIVSWLGYSIRRMSSALREARYWRPFRVQLCPALAGIQLLKDGGYLRLSLSEDGVTPPEIRCHPLPWGD